MPRKTKANNSYKEFIADQLAGIDGVRCRAMFGGYGLYRHDIFFAIIFGDRLYFRTDDRTRTEFTDRGMKPFQPSAKQQLTTYYEVPGDIVDHAASLCKWALLAVAVATSKE